jgi:hypothetical protein
MKLFEIKKCNFSDYNKNVIATKNNKITVPENYSGFNITFEIDINHSEILNDLRNKKNIEIFENTLTYTALCCNNEIVISVYDFINRNSSNETFATMVKQIIDTLNLWVIE